MARVGVSGPRRASSSNCQHLALAVVGILGLVLGGVEAAARSGDWSCAFQRREWARADDDAGDRAALVAFAKATELSQWYSGTRNWLNESVSVCEWEGICCQPAAGGSDHDVDITKVSSSSRVTEIHVERNGLRGAFPDEFAPSNRRTVAFYCLQLADGYA